MSDKGKEWLQKHVDYIFAECRGYIESKDNDCLNCLEGADTCYQVYEEIKRLIQQKPEIDDMEEYVYKKSKETKDLQLDIIANIEHLESEHIRLMYEEFVRQIVIDVKGLQVPVVKIKKGEKK